jgi:hypothetical protein
LFLLTLIFLFDFPLFYFASSIFYFSIYSFVLFISSSVTVLLLLFLSFSIHLLFYIFCSVFFFSLNISVSAIVCSGSERGAQILPRKLPFASSTATRHPWPSLCIVAKHVIFSSFSRIPDDRKSPKTQ